MTLLGFVPMHRDATLIWVKALCCEKATSQVQLHFISSGNGFIKRWLRLTLIIVNITVDLLHHLLPSYALQEQLGRAKIGPPPHICRCVEGHCLYSFGFIIRPINRTLPEWLSRIKNTNGWSARKTGISLGRTDVMPITTPVAAAASVPSSFTST